MKPLLAFVQRANKQINKLTELIKDLLDATKIQAGKLELRKRTFHLGEVIAECKEDIQTNSPDYEIILEGEQNL